MALQGCLEKVLKEWNGATGEAFSGHPLANFFRGELKATVKSLVFGDDFVVQASAGAGNWANVPWVSILDLRLTQSTQEGVYPVYLFKADGSGVYLSLGFGTTKLKEIYGGREAKNQARIIRESLRSSIAELGEWSEHVVLKSNTSLGQSYEWASAGAKYYPKENLPEDGELKEDLESLLKIYSQVGAVEDYLSEVVQECSAVKCMNLPKPFLLLAGISGTGKTRFVREQAKRTGSIEKTYQLVSVRPDWHEPSDLLGYTSRLTGVEKYVATDVLKFMVSAWKATGTEAEVNNGAPDQEIVWRGNPVGSIAPYWLCLDEMNLAPVEQYFADYLSVLETREWDWVDGEYRYSCEPLLSADTISRLASPDALAKDLGLDLSDDADKALWQNFCDYGIPIPFNLIVAGTVNMDETTHGFSRKVIDRALTIDFGEFFPNTFGEAFFSPTSEPVALDFPVRSAVKSAEDMSKVEADKDGKKSIEFLAEINEVLQGTPFELAYRALNELLLSVQCFAPRKDDELQAVWDDFLMSKVLPRIDGDEDKLTISRDGKRVNLLDGVAECLKEQFSDIWPQEARRVDLLREAVEGDDVVKVSCRSRKKLKWMRDRLDANTFTSFWP